MKIMERIIKPKWWKEYLLLGLVTNELCSYLLQAIVFVVRERSLPAWLILGIDSISFLITVLLLGLAVLSYRKGILEEPVTKQQVFEWSMDGIWLFISVIGVQYIPALILQYLTLLSPYLAMGVGAVLFVLFMMNLLIQVWIVTMDLQVEQSFVKKVYIFKCIWKRPVMLALALGVCLWSYFGEVLVDTLFYGIASVIGNSFVLQMLVRVIMAVANTAICIWFVSKAERFKEYVYQAEAEFRVTEIKKSKKVFLYTVTGVVALYLVANAVYVVSEKPAVNVADYMDVLMEEAQEAIEFQNSGEAVRIYALVEMYLSAMDAYANEDLDALQNYMQNNPSDDFLWRLYYTYVDDVELAKNMLIDIQTDTRLCHDILAHYAEIDTERNEAEEELVQDCIWLCLLNGDFIESSVKLDVASLRMKRINDIKENYEDTLAYNDLMALLLDSNARGGVDEDTAYQLLDMAEENPNDSAYQLMAVLGGSQYLYDEARHYDRVVACAQRLDGLMTARTTDVDSLIEQKLYLAKMVMECDDYEAALRFLMDVRLEKNTEVEDNILICYSQSKQDENVLSYVEELRAAGQDRAYLDYFAGLASLRMGNVDEALENGLRLAEKVQSDEVKREDNNVLLYNLVEYMCISDHYENYVDYYYRIKTYTPEQIEFLRKSPLLENYINAVNAVYNDHDYEVAISSLEEIEKICPDMSLTWFLKGTAYFDLREYDNAMECFKKCISIDENNTTAIYSLAVLYDISGDYDTSAQLCEQIMEVLPTVNHEKDWYGVAYHTRALYERIQEYVGGQR